MLLVTPKPSKVHVHVKSISNFYRGSIRETGRWNIIHLHDVDGPIMYWYFGSPDLKVDWIFVDLERGEGGTMYFLIHSQNDNRMFISQSSDSNSTKKIVYPSNKIDMYI